MVITNDFEDYTVACKSFAENKAFADLTESVVAFNASCLEIADVNDAEVINNEINLVSRKIFRFSMILESQNQVLQLLEDEFDMWYAKKYTDISKAHTGSKPLTGVFIETVIKTENEVEYSGYRSKINSEKYKVSVLKRTVAALESYSYKLHDLQSYRKAAIQKGL